MPLLKERIYTTKDIYNLPEGERAELIDGQIYDMSPPNFMHQKLVSEFTQVIGQYIKRHNGSCEVMPAPFAVFLNEDDKTYVEPDISILCDNNKITDKGCIGAPDWVIEIVSPSTQKMDYGIKLFKYRTSGVREYWIVNPTTKMVNVYDFEKEDGTAQHSFEDSIQSCIYSDLVITIADLLK